MVIEFEPQTLVDALSEAVRQQVLSGALPPGSRVTEQQIATTYGVARPTAKAAIERVVQTGILRRSANKTARVPELSESDLRDLYLSRVLFEREVITSLAIRGHVPAKARAAMEAMQRTVDTDGFTEMVESDIQFHRSLVDGLGSPRISRMYETILGEVHLSMAHEQSSGVIDRRLNYDEHEQIVSAIDASDVAQTRTLITAHLVSAANRLLKKPLSLDGWV